MFNDKLTNFEKNIRYGSYIKKFPITSVIKFRNLAIQMATHWQQHNSEAKFSFPQAWSTIYDFSSPFLPAVDDIPWEETR